MQDLRGVAALAELERQGTISGAAYALGYTPSAVSQQLASLEREIGFALVERGPRSARLNAAGRELLAGANTAIALLNVAEARAASAAGRMGGRVVIAAIPSVASLVAAAVVGLRRAEPFVDIALVQLDASRAQHELIDGRADLAIIDDWGARTPVVDARLTSTACFTEPIVLVLRRSERPASASWIEVLEGTLPVLPWLCATPGNYSREFGDEFLSRNGLSPKLRWEFDGLHTIAELVAAGQGVSLLPTSVARTSSLSQFALPDDVSRTVKFLRRRRGSEQVVSAESLCADVIVSALSKRGPARA